ncbi:hypothetical protein GBAR_LOCUS21677 [Geodia barretti]|nr:hypothetical protein GBAR_LOCUS21677 [Geodia barretti]
MESTTLLLIHGADVDVANNRGDTPLHSAAKWNRPLIVHNLLLYGAQHAALNYCNQTPIQLTNDEDVQLHIVNAASGVIDVGSYRRHTLSSSSSAGVGRAVDWTELGSGVTSTELRSGVTSTELGSGVTSTELRRSQPSSASGELSPPPSDGSHGDKADQQNTHTTNTHEAVDPIERPRSAGSLQTDNQDPPLITVTTTIPSSNPTHPTSSPPVSPSPCIPSSPPLSSSPPSIPSPLHLTPSHLPPPDGATSTETGSENDFVFV